MDVQDFNLVIDGFQQLVKLPLPKSLVLTATEIDSLAVASIGIYDARRQFTSITFEKP